jgi:hypothetical protein
MSKSTQLDRNVKLYLLSIMAEGREGEQFTINESIQYWNDTFKSEYQWRVDQAGQIKALTDWLQGLGLDGMAFNNWDIIQLAIQWGSLPEKHTESQADKILENYWNFMANKLNQLFNGYRVPKTI